MLIESIRVLDGEVPLLALHQRRMDRARRSLFAKSPVIKLAKLLADTELPPTGLHKLRIEYAERVSKTEVTPYALRPVASLRVVDAAGLHYGKKFADRSGINALFARRGAYDDILMTQDGYLMDTSYANLALYDGYHWYTPAYPLLKWVRREKLLRAGTIRPAIIRTRDLPNFRRARMMNAMLEWEEGPEIAAENIVLEAS